MDLVCIFNFRQLQIFADHGSQISKLVGSSSASPTRKQTNTPQQRLIRFKKLHDQLQVLDQDYQPLATELISLVANMAPEQFEQAARAGRDCSYLFREHQEDTSG